MRIASPRAIVVAASIIVVALAGAVAVPSLASAAPLPPKVDITEFAYGGVTPDSSTKGDGEYVEVTNLESSPVSLSGWTYNRDNGTAISLTDLGTLAAGASGIITDLAPVEFRTAWGLDATVPVVNDGSTKLDSGAHTVVIADQNGTVADQVSWAGGYLSGKGVSAWVDQDYVGAKADTTGWHLSTDGDAQHSVTKTTAKGTAIGSPGSFVLAVAPGGGTTPPTGPEAPCDTEDSGTAPGTVPAGAVTWPGNATPATIDAQCDWVTAKPNGSGQDLSGLAFDPTNANVLYAVKNKNHVYRLIRSGGSWVKDTANGWTSGKDIFFPGGGGLPDSEGLTVGPDGALYITTERDNAAKTVPLDSILRFDPTSPATSLTATDQWTLTADLGYAPTDSDDSNLGFEGVAYVPDSFLVSEGFRTDAGAVYDPADYPAKAVHGLFFGAVEKTGHLIAYALDADHSWARVADVPTGMVGVMDASFDPDLGRIWAHCDNTCGNATALLKIGADGHFLVDRSYARPAGLPNYNLEGFAVAPASTSANGQREVLWADDGNRFGHSLWSGTLATDLQLPVSIVPSTTTPAPGQRVTLSVDGLTPGTEYQAVLHSTPTVLGTGVAGSTGRLVLSVTIPSGTAPGAHTITIAPTSDPSGTVATVAITVTALLAATGVAPGAGLLGGGALLVLGAGLLLGRRALRRRVLA